MANTKYLKLSDLNSYNEARKLSTLVWEVVNKWDWFHKSTIGTQWIKSIDSISANIAEGFGRYGKKDKIKFCYYARGSTYESLDWLNKSKERNLIQENDFQEVKTKLVNLPKEINHLINFLSTKLLK